MRIPAAILAMFIVSGCGFRPIYDESKPALPVKVGAVKMAYKDHKTLGAVFARDLERALNGSVNSVQPRYIINSEAVVRTQSFDTQSNSVSLRTRVTITVHYQIVDRDGEVVDEDSIMGYDSFEVTSSPYSTLVSEEQTIQQLARSLANEIVLKIAALELDS